MADKENKKELEAKTDKQDEKTKADKPKSDKPSVWERAKAWFKSVKAECKKINWASRKSVQQNSLIVIVCVIIFSIALGILDYCFSGAIVGLSRLI